MAVQAVTRCVRCIASLLKGINYQMKPTRLQEDGGMSAM